MREIKFRAHYNGRLFEVTEIYWSIRKVHLFDLDTRDEEEVSFDEIDLLQYTGLNDKNGMEIYEGYILVYRKLITEFSYKDKAGHYRTKTRTKPKEELHYWTVFWNERHGWMIKRFEATNSLWKAVENHQVIGNIYENPELIGSYPASFKSEEEEQTNE